MSGDGEVTRWLGRLAAGEPGALDHVVPLLYDELRSLARALLRHEREGHTLAPTALVHELYLRLRDQRRVGAGERGAFFAAAAATMRRILVDAARRRQRHKRGGGAEVLALDDAAEPAFDPLRSDREAEEVLALDLALERLRSASPRAAQVVELRFFAGLGVEEAAAALALHEKTVRRDWVAARAWLRRELGTASPEACRDG